MIETPPLHLQVEPGFEEVAEEFVRNFQERDEVGAACVVYLEGEKVVELHGGLRDPELCLPWQQDTLTLLYSTTKGFSAMVLARLNSLGLLDYDAPVAEYWPEFAARGKEAVTVRQLLAHQAGLPAVEHRIRPMELGDQEFLAGLLAETEPAWEPGTRSGYHAVTFGWLAAELARRLDPEGRSIGRQLREEIAGPLGADLYLGLPRDFPEERLADTVDLSPGVALRSAAELPRRFLLNMANPYSLSHRALLNPRFRYPGDYGRPPQRYLEIPGANAMGSAEAVARVYSCLAGGGEAIGLSQETFEQLQATPVPPSEWPLDLVLCMDAAFTLGFMRPETPDAWATSPRAFGHFGAGGSFGYADPETGIGYGYVMSRMGARIRDDPRERALRHALRRCLDRRRVRRLAREAADRDASGPLRLRVRHGRHEDLPAIVAIYNQAIRDTPATFDTVEKTVADQEDWFRAHGPEHPLLVAKHDEEVVGWASLSAWSDRCAYAATSEVSLYVHEAWRGRGVGSELLRVLVEAADRVGKHALLARITTDNEASLRLHERLGFRRVGVLREVGRKFGRLHDVALLQRLEGAGGPRWVTASELRRDLEALGVAPGQTLMLHAAVSRLGRVLGGPDVVLRVLLDLLGPEGTLVMYTSWESAPYHLDRFPPELREGVEDEYPAYDPETSPAMRPWSILTEYLRKWPGARRSAHPEANLVAVGARAEWLVDPHPLHYGYGPGTPLARFVEAGGQVLLLGAPLETVTLLHHAEHLAEVPDKRVVRYRMPVLEEGQRRWVDVEEYDTGRGIRPWDGEDYFARITRQALEEGVGRSGPVGRGEAHLLDGPGLVALGVRWMEANLRGEEVRSEEAGDS